MAVTLLALALVALATVASCEEELHEDMNRQAVCTMDTPLLTSDQQQQLVTWHNQYRAAVNASNMYAMTWDNGLASRAQAFANSVFNSSYPTNDYTKMCDGRTINYNTFSVHCIRKWKISDAMNFWMKQMQYYNYANNSCAANQWCGSYTQIVADSSRLIGCGAAYNIYGSSVDTFIVCNYYPPIASYYQLPYTMGPAATTCGVTNNASPAAAGVGWTARSDGFCDVCQAGTAGCNCFNCVNGTVNASTCTCNCNPGFNGLLCDANCADRYNAAYCQSIAQYCGNYQYWMQQVCPCTCSAAGNPGFNCCASNLG